MDKKEQMDCQQYIASNQMPGLSNPYPLCMEDSKSSHQILNLKIRYRSSNVVG